MNDSGIITLQPRKPLWWRAEADMTVEIQDSEGEFALHEIIDAAEHLGSGQTISIRLDYEPELLYQLMDNKGFSHWAQPKGGGWRIDFYKPGRRI